MKTAQLSRLVIIIIAFITTISFSGCKSSTQKAGNTSDKEEIKGNISISGAFALYPLLDVVQAVVIAFEDP